MKKLDIPCKLFIDFNDCLEPRTGDVLISSGGSNYLVIKVRKNKGLKHPNRWHFECLRIDLQAEPSIDSTTQFIHFSWYSRGKNKSRRKTSFAS